MSNYKSMRELTREHRPKANDIREDLQKYPHVPDKKTTHDSRYDADRYISIQTKVNSDPNFERYYINKIAADGWVALENPQHLLLYTKGRTFKYRLNGDSMSRAPEGTFRSGGYLIGRNMDDPENNDKYILYKGYNGAIFSLQIKDIMEVYIKSKKREIPIFKNPDHDNKTNFPVYLEDYRTGKNVIVYYAKDEYNRRRFMNSQKYKTALMLNRWSFSAVFSE